MKQIWIRKNGAPEVLRLQESDDLGDPGDREVLVDVHYSGINFADVIMRQGLYPDAPAKPYVPGYEASGIILKTGKAVTRFRVGDSVIVGCLFGGYASQLIAPEDLLFSLPGHLTLQEGAGIAVNWVTAHAAIMDMGRVRAGDRCVIDSATGGVGTIALQMLKKLGAETVGLTSSTAKFEYIKSLGAFPMTQINFRNDTNRSGYDFILNSLGGATLREHYDRLAMGGRVVAIGMSVGIRAGSRDLFTFVKAALQMPKFSIIKMFDHNRGVYALNALTLLGDPAYRQSLDKKWRDAEPFKLKPHIDRVFPATEAAAAHSYLESKKATGKILLSWK